MSDFKAGAFRARCNAFELTVRMAQLCKNQADC